MLWILSALRFSMACARHGLNSALVPLVFALACALGGAACRGDDTVAPPGSTVDLDDSDASPVAGTIQGSFAVSSTGEGTYTLPLVVPPGAAGMQPSLAIRT